MHKGHTQFSFFEFLPYFKINLAIFLSNLGVIILILFLRKNLQPVVPLYYAKPSGEEQLSENLLLTLPPLISGIITIINSLLAKLTKDSFLQQVLVGSAIAATTLSTITVLKIIFLVGNL